MQKAKKPTSCKNILFMNNTGDKQQSHSLCTPSNEFAFFNILFFMHRYGKLYYFNKSFSYIKFDKFCVNF